MIPLMGAAEKNAWAAGLVRQSPAAKKRSVPRIRLCAYLAVAVLARRWVLRSGRWSIGLSVVAAHSTIGEHVASRKTWWILLSDPPTNAVGGSIPSAPTGCASAGPRRQSKPVSPRRYTRRVVGRERVWQGRGRG